MKKILFLSLFFISSAFAETPESFSRTEKSITINSWQNTAEITVTEFWENKTANDQNFRLVYPISSHAQNFTFFVASEARNFEALEGEKRLETLFNLAQTQKNTKWFSYANFPFSSLIFSENIVVPKNTNLRVKYQWTQDLDFITDFHLLPIFWADGEKSEKFTVKFVRDGFVYHIVSDFLNLGKTYKTEKSFIWNSEILDFNPQKNFFLFFSETPTANLEFSADDFTYQARFSLPQRKKTPKNILMLIDASGSMYGENWNRLAQILPKIWKTIPETSQIKIGVLNKESVFLSAEFLPNQYENQKKWLENLTDITPLGKFNEKNFSEILVSLGTKNPPIDKIILLGDFSDFKVPETMDFTGISGKIIALDFSKNELFRFFIRRLNGQYLDLFSSAFGFSESEAFENIWKFSEQESALFNKEVTTEWLPETRYFFPQETDLSLSRKPGKSEQFTPLADFLPSWWAQYQVAKHLKSFLQTGFDAEKFEAMQSIDRFFGLDLEWLKDLKTLSEKTVWQIIWDLEDFQPKISKIFTQKSVPFYAETQFNFETKNLSKNTVTIAPFSEAQKKLFLAFPDIFSAPFSVGENMQFCDQFRCLKVSKNGQSDFDKGLLLYWRGHDFSHWGYAGVEILSRKNIFPVLPDGKIEFEKLVSRAEFMHWSAQYFFPNERQNFMMETPVFLDLPKNTETAKSIEFLRTKRIVGGFLDGTVRPEQNLTRAEAIKILLAIKGITPNPSILAENLPFSDISGWEIPWIVEAQKRGIISGYADGTFRPLAPLNYAEAAKLIVTGS